MKTIGIIGGVASGKSTVARMMVELGAGHLDADRTGHEVLADDAEVAAALRGEWGDAVFDVEGQVDRAALASRVFSSDAEAEANRKFLEGLLHARIARRLKTACDKFASEGRPAVVLDAPLLLEAAWGPMCDLLLMVESPHASRLARAAGRGWSEMEFSRREAAQWPLDEKRRTASLTVANDGSLEDLRDAVRQVWAAHVGPVEK